MTREQQNNRSLLEGDAPAEVAGLHIRPMSLTTLSMLETVGNPLAAAVGNAEDDAQVRLSMADLLEVVYIHAAPKADVRRHVKNYGILPEAFADAVQDFGERLRPEDLKAIMSVIQNEQESVAAASAQPIPTSGDPSKN